MVGLYEDGRQGDELFEFFKGLPFVFGPFPHLSLLGELVKGFGHVQEVLDESLVEIDEPNK